MLRPDTLRPKKRATAKWSSSWTKRTPNAPATKITHSRYIWVPVTF